MKNDIYIIPEVNRRLTNNADSLLNAVLLFISSFMLADSFLFRNRQHLIVAQCCAYYKAEQE